jgi:TRAP-type C4-dicarboxylate transport system permease small subunit
MLQPLARGLEAVDRGARYALIGLMGTMVVVVSVQVFLRYLFNSSLGWADEVSRLAFVWSVFLAIPLCIKEGLHVGIEMLTHRLPQKLQRALACVTDAAGAALMILVCYQAVIIARDQWDEKMASVDASAAWFIVAVAAGSALSAVELFRLMLAGKPAASRAIVVE